MSQVAIWPDGFWCFAGEIDQYPEKSNDFITRNIPNYSNYQDIEIMIKNVLKGKGSQKHSAHRSDVQKRKNNAKGLISKL